MTPKTSTLPHQHHQHHHHYHHVHNPSQNPGKSKSNGDSNSELASGPDNNTKIAKTALELQDYSSNTDPENKKFIVKKDDTQSRSFSDIRKSAPDVIIITGSSH